MTEPVSTQAGTAPCDDLVSRLTNDVLGGGMTCADCQGQRTEAAARIEALTAKLAEVEQERDAAKIVLGGYEKMLKAADKVEAQRDAALAALRVARNRIEVLGAMHSDPKHFIANEQVFLPEIDEALSPSDGEKA